MESSYPTPSPSSHASSILRAALGTPTPSPHHSPTPTHDTAANTVDSSVDNNSPPPQRPVYNMFGLDLGASDSSSTIGDSEANQRSMEPPYKRIQPLVLPPRRHIITVSPNVKPRATSHSDIFGPLRSPFNEYGQRRVAATHAVSRKRRRTAAWVNKLRMDIARGRI
ncbi:hypothetical protein C8J57DRAFT_1717183 [Mycena rebaudengoi]|nr:hypothetical protein C8J57DRAFT_1717183 [Mycena rebaudengoi]